MGKTENPHCGIKFTASLLHPRYWLIWFGLLLAIFVAQLPNTMRHKLGQIIGNRVLKKNKKRRNVVRVNLKKAFPELDENQLMQLTKEHLQWYGCALVDYSLLFFGSKKRIASMVEIQGQEHIDQAIKQDQSIIILLAHSVMLEFAPAAISLEYESFGSYKTSKNAVLDWMIARGRCRHVSFVVSREEGMRKLIKSLVPKRLMIFLPDEDLGIGNAVFAPFFNILKATLTTTARLTRMGKAVALPTFVWYDISKKKYIVQISPSITDYPTGDAVEDATSLNKSLEKLIKEHPEQYMWMMKWYKTRPEGEESFY